MSSECSGIVNNIEATQNAIDAANVAYKNAHDSFNDLGCWSGPGGSWFSNDECDQLRESMNTQIEEAKRQKGLLGQYQSQYISNGCQPVGSGCTNASINMMACVKDINATVTCANASDPVKDRCCRLTDAATFYTNMANAYSSRLANAQACLSDAQSNYDVIQAKRSEIGDSMGGAPQHDGADSAFTERVFTQLSGILQEQLDKTPGANFVDSTDNHVAWSFDNPEAGGAVVRGYIQAFKSSAFLQNLIGFTVPSLSSVGETTPLPVDRKVECGMDTSVSAGSYYCYSDLDNADILPLQVEFDNKITQGIEELFPGAREGADINFAASKCFDCRGGPSRVKLLKGAFTGAGQMINDMKNLALRGLDAAEKPLAALLEKAKTNLHMIVTQQQVYSSLAAKATADKLELEEQLFKEAVERNKTIKQSMMNIIKDKIYASSPVTIQARSCDGQRVVVQSIPNTDKDGRVITNSRASAFISVWQGQATIKESVVSRYYPEEKRCCSATTEERFGPGFNYKEVSENTSYAESRLKDAWSYPINLSVNVKVNIRPEYEETIRDMPGIRDIDTATQDSIISSLKSCTNTLTYCIGQTN